MNTLIEISPEELAQHANKRLSCNISNPAKPDIFPPLLYISQSVEEPEELNELHLTIVNNGPEEIQFHPWPKNEDSLKVKFFGFLHIRMPQNRLPHSNLALSYLCIDFTDFVGTKYQPWLKFEVEGEDNNWNFVRVSKSMEKDGIFQELPPSSSDENSVWLLRYNGSEPFTLSEGASIKISIKSVFTHYRPSLRYVDVFYKGKDERLASNLIQSTIELKRPPNYVSPPFPLKVYWLDNHNAAYISDENLEIKNELRFGISNIGLGPLKLDCRESVVEGPYFELVFLGGKETGDFTKDQYIKDIQLELLDESYGDKWTHHKMIQGPDVVWRIEPVLYKDDGTRNSQILGTNEGGTITFSLNQLRVEGNEGVSMIYLKYYNIPDFDDNQIVLFIEKKPTEGSIPSAGFEQKYLKFDDSDTKKFISAPLKWDIRKNGDQTETILSFRDKVGIGTDKPLSVLHVKGDTIISNKLLIGSGTSNRRLTVSRRNEDKTGQLELRTEGGISNGNFDGLYFTQGENGQTPLGSFRLIHYISGLPDFGFFTRKQDNAGSTQEVERLRIANNGNVGIGNSNPQFPLTIGEPGKTWDDYGITSDKRIGVVDGVGSRKTMILGMSKAKGYIGSFDYETLKPLPLLINLDGGSVGIGTDSPSETLHIRNDRAKLRIEDADGLNNIYIYPWASGVNIYKTGNAAHPTYFGRDGDGSNFVFHSGNVGIGIDSPKAKLHVVGSQPGNNLGSKTFGWSAGNAVWDGGAGNFSILASDSIAGPNFMSTSDARIKCDVKESDGEKNLQLLLKVGIKNYQYKDKFAKGDRLQLGVIAQEIEQLMPESVTIHEDFIPDIYEKPHKVELKDTNELVVEMKNPHGLTTGDYLRIMFTGGFKDERVTVNDPVSFCVHHWQAGIENIFIYGKQVSDFRTVNYDHIFSLNVSATQELAKQVKALQAECQILRDELSKLKTQ